MKKILTVSLLLLLALGGLTRAAENSLPHPLVWCGLDYSKVKMIGTLDFRKPDQIFPGALQEWNGLFMAEMMPKLEAMEPSVESDLDAVKARNDQASTNQIEREDGTRAEKVTPTHITDADIASIIASYQLKHTQGTGLVFIMDRLVKAQATGCFYVVFFDISSKKVLHSERLSESAGGGGFRNYWFRPVKTGVGKLPKIYKTVKPAN